MTFTRFLKSAIIERPRFIRPLWYLRYSKEEAQTLLKSRYRWEYYGGHHLENRMTSFCHGVYLPGKFGADMRNNTLSARVRNGTMERAAAWSEYNTPPTVEPQLVEYFRKRLGFDESEYNEIMAMPPRSWHEFPTYKRRFERFRPIFALLAKADLVPMSFYLKYCFPDQAPA